MKPEQLGLHLRDGGGTMGAMIRAKDWSGSALGPVEQWPQSLRTALSICLASKFPMLIWWGPSLSVVYNDAYIPIWGNKHPWVLGRSGTDAWGEVWDVIGPMLRGVIERGEASWSEDTLLVLRRYGFSEECYFTWSYSPIVDESGGVGGAFTAVTETTQRVIGERRLTTLRALGERLGDVREVATACERAMEVVGANPYDFPFAALYLVDEHGASACARTANARGNPGLPDRLDFDDPRWPIATVVDERRSVGIDDVSARVGTITGVWPEPIERAMVVPITKAGGRPRGVLISGCSPRLALDEPYAAFLELAAGHIAAALSSASSYAEERRRAEALAELDRAKTSFFANISHEFRTPLTLMIGPTEDALRSEDRVLGGDALVAVHRNEVRLLKLVNALLDFSRIEAGRVRAQHEPTDLPQLTRELSSAFRSAMERAGLAFEVTCAPFSSQVLVDRSMWEKIVLNLLSNALKFTFEGKVSVELRATGETTELVVADTGTGIPPEEQARLFERFHRIEGARSRTHEGSGIGLALTHELVRLHGGSIEVESEVGRGTRFIVRVPLRSAEHASVDPHHLSTSVSSYVEEALRWLPDDAPDQLADEPAALSSHAPTSCPDATLLVADDNADMRDYLRRLLGERWRVTVVPDGARALEAARRRRPDLVVTDVMMPNLDGFGLLREMRAEPSLAGVPVLLLSARAGEEARIEGIEAGADDYLVKPFSARELVARVTNMLQLAALRREVELERNRLVDFVEQTPVGVAIWEGADLRCAMCNDAYRALARREVVLGTPVRELFPELVDTGALEPMERVLLDGIGVETTETRVTLRGDDGVERDGYYSTSFRPLRDAAGAVTGVITVTVDVTAQALARKAIEDGRTAAEAANRAKDEFLAMLGHELRNPLAPILTALELMRLRAGPTCERERAVIERQTRHLAALVDDLLDVSRIARGKVDLKKRPVLLAQVIARAVETAAPIFEVQRHELVTDVPEVVVEADEVRLSQVFSNVLTNAAKYTDPGGRISVIGALDGDGISVHVTDTGRGIAADMLPRIFDLFVQGRQAIDRAQGGLGLGLSIVKNMVHLHGGTVSAASDGPGRGSTFSIWLPRAAGLAAPPPPRAPTRAETSSRGIVLVVDDNSDAADLLASLLDAFGYTAHVARDGVSAMSIAQQLVPDVALLDIGLPVMDGYELARRLRTLPAWRDVRLIAVTGYGQAEDRQRSREAGFDAHLVKPVELPALREVLADLTLRKRMA